MAEMITSKNFGTKELACKCCGVNGMKPVFVKMLQQLRDHYGRPMILTSAFRCKKHNEEIGGEIESWHMRGLAVDIHCVSATERFEIVNIALALGFRGIGIDSAFVHIDHRTTAPVIWIYPEK